MGQVKKTKKKLITYFEFILHFICDFSKLALLNDKDKIISSSADSSNGQYVLRIFFFTSLHGVVVGNRDLFQIDWSGKQFTLQCSKFMPRTSGKRMRRKKNRISPFSDEFSFLPLYVRVIDHCCPSS